MNPSDIAHEKNQQPVEVTGFSEVGGGGFEPPTPGFSIVVSKISKATPSPVTERGYAGSSKFTPRDVEQIAQHVDIESTDLAFVLRHWSSLCDATQDAILKLVRDGVSVSRTS